VRLGGSVLRVDVGDEVSEVVRGQQRFGRLVGVSPAMQEVYGLLAAVAPTDATVLILGETGTGKELAAEAIHRQSPPAQAPFQVLDCGAIPENLIESEFFGHEKGAFTGATQAREGVFERARGGTVFLDEIGELPQLLQTRLLRVLDRRQVKRVGGTSLRRVDVRLVAATNRDLRQEVEQGRFRQDLYYRLAVVCVVLPPLRQRREDIPLLARHFLWQSGCPDPDTVLTPDMLELLETRRWRGNVRELRNAIEEAVVLVDGAAGRQPQSALLQRESADEGLRLSTRRSQFSPSPLPQKAAARRPSRRARTTGLAEHCLLALSSSPTKRRRSNCSIASRDCISLIYSSNTGRISLAWRVMPAWIGRSFGDCSVVTGWARPRWMPSGGAALGGSGGAGAGTCCRPMGCFWPSGCRRWSPCVPRTAERRSVCFRYGAARRPRGPSSRPRSRGPCGAARWSQSKTRAIAGALGIDSGDNGRQACGAG
jgi:transcriptional regulator with AAA-type ATPase domain